MAGSSLWRFMSDRDKKKLAKAGFATPRGGGKNAYQNHVSRSNRVIVPFERLDDVDLARFEDGHVIRVLPEQCFDAPGQLAPGLSERGVEIGPNGFVLYRTHSAYDSLPPLDTWAPRGLQTGEQARRRGVPDTGEYVVRLSNPPVTEGLPQGIFAPEYATREDNAVCQAVLAWLIGRTRAHPYSAELFGPLTRWLEEYDSTLIAEDRLEHDGIVVKGEARCPLCARPLTYMELHEMLDLTDALGLANAGLQIAGATRSTAINLFHMQPLLYGSELNHRPSLVARGHAVCNTLLGQRACIPLREVESEGFELLREGGGVWGFSSVDETLLRSEDRGTWARLVERGLPEVPLSDALGPEVVIGEDEDGDGDDAEGG